MMHKGKVPVQMLKYDPNIKRMKGNGPYDTFAEAISHYGDYMIEIDDFIEMISINVSDRVLEKLVPRMKEKEKHVNKNIVMVMIGTPSTAQGSNQNQGEEEED